VVTWTLVDLAGEGFEHGIPGEQLAEVAGLSVPRVYQIRDGRRATHSGVK
jgi:hypothetical protein